MFFVGDYDMPLSREKLPKELCNIESEIGSEIM
jgi:hypothetical protein